MNEAALSSSLADPPFVLPATPSAGARGAPVSSIIVKLAARCNLACGYCYWFRDQTVLNAPKTMPLAVQRALVERLRGYFERHAPPEMTLILHGGEPLLFGKARFLELCRELRAMESAASAKLHLRLTTNGVLLDEEWSVLLRYFDVGATISIDGPAAMHDLRRPDLRGRGTHAATMTGLLHLRKLGLEPGVLAVADPATSPSETLAFFFDELRSPSVDFLIPDATHDGEPRPSIAPWFIKLFDLWFDRYASRGAEIRLFQAMIRSLCGQPSGVESIGYGPISAVTVCTDGALEAHDVVRIAGNGATASRLNILKNDLEEIEMDPLWRELRAASLDLAPLCRSCEWRFACGGGHIASRYSFERRFDNPSVYCRDLKLILAHIWWRILPTLTFEQRKK